MWFALQDGDIAVDELAKLVKAMLEHTLKVVYEVCAALLTKDNKWHTSLWALSIYVILGTALRTNLTDIFTKCAAVVTHTTFSACFSCLISTRRRWLKISSLGLFSSSFRVFLTCTAFGFSSFCDYRTVVYLTIIVLSL